MASYSAVIDVRVQGQDELRALTDGVGRLTQLVKNIKPVPTLFDKRGTDEVKRLKTELSDLVKAYADGNTRVAKFSTSLSGLSQQLVTFRSVANNARTGTDEFTNALKAAEITSGKLLRAEMERLNTLQSLYTRSATGSLSAADQGPSKLVQDLLAVQNTLPGNIASLRAYQSELNRVFDLVEAGSTDYLALQQAIANVNRQLDIATGVGPVQGPVPPPRPPGLPGMPAPMGPTSPVNPLARQAKMQENLMLGAGFPLLFGGGAGQVAGGLAGSLIGTGFGGQIIGSAVLGIVEDLAKRFNDISAAAQTLDITKLRGSVIFVNDQLSVTVDLLKRAGKADEARALLAEEIANQTGVLPEYAQRLSQNSNILSNTWNKFLGAASGFASILMGPTAAALTVLLSGFTKILQYVNDLSSSLANKVLNSLIRVVEKSAFFKAIIDRILNLVTDKTEEQMLAEREATKELLKNQQAARDAFVARTKAEIDNATIIKKLNGDTLTDYNKLLDTEATLKKVNEDRYALLQQIASIEAKGGIAAGLITPEEMSKLKTGLLELETKKYELQIEVNKESLRLFEDQIKTAAERSTRALDLQAGALQGQGTVYQSRLSLEKASNDLYLQRLSMEEEFLNKQFEQTGNLNEQLAILDRLAQIVEIRFKLNIANAKIERDGAIAQLKLGNALLQIELKKQQIQYKTLVAVMEEAKAKGLLNQAYIDAVDAQYDAVLLAEQALNFGIENAKVQEKIANAMYDQQVESAAYARNLELAELATRRTDAINGANRSTSGFQLGQTWTGPSFVVQLPTATALTPMAVGGYVTRPTPALIGEGGQGEYVVPESRAASFAMNYLMGARGAGAVDGDATIPAINITTGPVMQQGGQNYVTIQDMEAGLQAVADTILNNSRSYSSRRFTGVT